MPQDLVPYRRSFNPMPLHQVDVFVSDCNNVCLSQDSQEHDGEGVTVVLHPEQVDQITKWMTEAKEWALRAIDREARHDEHEVSSE